MTGANSLLAHCLGLLHNKLNVGYRSQHLEELYGWVDSICQIVTVAIM